jgi:hypothetical protein
LLPRYLLLYHLLRVSQTYMIESISLRLKTREGGICHFMGFERENVGKTRAVIKQHLQILSLSYKLRR